MQNNKSRALVAVLDAEVARLLNLDARATGARDVSKLMDSFARLVEALAWEPEPEPRRNSNSGRSGKRPAMGCGYRWTKAPIVLAWDSGIMDRLGGTRGSTAPRGLELHREEQAHWLAVPVTLTLGCGGRCSLGKLYCGHPFSHQHRALTRIQEALRDMTRQMAASASLSGRIKSLESIRHKMQRRQIACDDILDVIGARVVLETVDECYRLLDSVHARFERICGYQRDYIASPKANGYQSLHTTVRDDEGRPIEIQLRTAEMHDYSEHGEAAHYLYKSDSPAG